MRKSKQCSRCKKNKSEDNYYLAASDLINSDGRISICRDCLSEIVDYKDVKSFINILRQIDRPFIKTNYDSSLTYNNPLGEYMRRLGMKQNRKKTYLDSSFEGELPEMVAKTSDELDKKNKAEDHMKFKITPDMIVRWGDDYTDKELYELEQFYRDMKDANDITTPQHIASLKLLCKIYLAQNKALQAKEYTHFKSLNQQYNKVLQDSGFRPIDRKSGSESTGIRTFSQIWEEIEKDGFIPPYKYEEKQDIVDKTIMYMGNYTRSLVNMQSMPEPPTDTPKVDGSDEE